MIENSQLASPSEEHTAALNIAALTTAHSFRDDSEEALAQRFSRAPRRIQEELIFEFTRDPALIHQYHMIYENRFRDVHNAIRYRGMEDEHDPRSHILIARRGNLCVGGARLSATTPRQPHLLPVEMGNFRLDQYFPHLKQKELSYGQIGRVCLLPEFGGGAVTKKLMWNIYRKTVALGLDVVFGTAPITNARVYRQNCVAMGLRDVTIHEDIELPPYPMCEELKFYLISGTVDKSPLRTNAALEQSGVCAEA